MTVTDLRAQLKPMVERQAADLARIRNIPKPEALGFMARSFERDRRDSLGTEWESYFRIALEVVDEMRGEAPADRNPGAAA